MLRHYSVTNVCRAARYTPSTYSAMVDSRLTYEEDDMRVSLKAIALSSAILWGGAMLIVGLIHLAVPSYGADSCGS